MCRNVTLRKVNESDILETGSIFILLLQEENRKQHYT